MIGLYICLHFLSLLKNQQKITFFLLIFSILEQWLWTAYKILHPNHVWILEIEYRLLFLYGKKLKSMKFWKKPIQLRMLQLGLHLLEVNEIILFSNFFIFKKMISFRFLA